MEWPQLATTGTYVELHESYLMLSHIPTMMKALQLDFGRYSSMYAFVSEIETC